MFDLELVRILFVFGVLSINAVYDLKYRAIAGSDKINCLLILGGFSLMILDTYDSTLRLEIFMFMVSLIFIVFLWRIRLVAGGDIMILLVVCSVLPTNFLPITTVVIASILTIVIVFSYNVVLNIITKLKGNKLFNGYNISIPKQCVAFFITHKKRSWEKYVLSVEDGKSLDLLKFQYSESDYEDEPNIKNNTIVSVTIPFIFFMLLAFPLALLFTSLFMTYLLLLLSNTN